jgi:copper chaperone
MTMIEIRVPDMTCGHCAGTITRALKDADPGAAVEVSLADKRVRVTTRLAAGEVAECIADAGYTPQAA